MSVADVALSPVFGEESVHSAAGFFESRVGHFSPEPIMLYLRVAGSLIPMRVWESDSIASVKLRIQTCKGFVVKKQKLVFAGRELARSDTLVKDYGITGENVLHLVLRLSDLLHITVRTIGGKELDFHVDRHRKVGYLKQRILKKGKAYDPEDQELFCNGEKLDDQRLIDDICKNTDDVIHLVVQKSAKVRAKHIEKDLELSVVAENSSDRRDHQASGVVAKNITWGFQHPDFFLEPIVVNPQVKIPSYLWDMLKSTFDGLEKGAQPIRSSEGTGGTYFMQDSFQEFISVFKPLDEEPNAVNNPHGLPVSPDGQGLKRGTRVGEGAVREVAAFLLDHPKGGHRNFPGEVTGFAGVPPTVLVKCLHKGFNHPKGYDGSLKDVKIGSLQMFKKNDGSCEDMGPSRFPVEEVHKISVFDIRMANADRHAGNILFHKGEDGKTVLIPIDHGYCLPENFEDCTFDWLYWPQAIQPYSPDVVEYINSLDAEYDIALMKFYGWDMPLECARTLRVSTMLLKKGVQRGLTPFAIGNLMCRENVNEESVIEEIVRKAQDSLLPGMSEAAFLEAVSQVMDSQLDKVAN